MATSKSIQPPWIFSTSSEPPTTSAPASRACSSCSPLQKTITRRAFPVPCGNTTVPRMVWSPFSGSTLSEAEISTASSNFVAGSCFSRATASAKP